MEIKKLYGSAKRDNEEIRKRNQTSEKRSALINTIRLGEMIGEFSGEFLKCSDCGKKLKKSECN